MTKKEIIYRVLERVKAMSDDSDITEELVSSMIDTKRAMMLKQQYSKSSWNIPIELQQEICMSLETVDTIDGFKGAGQTIRTAEAIPDPIKIKGNMGPLIVRREDGSAIPINVIPVERIPYIGNNRYTAMLTYAAMDLNKRLILVSKDDKLKFLKKIRVTHIFQNPEDAYSMECRDNGYGTIEPWDMEYPLEHSMVDVIVDQCVKDLLRTIQLPEDKINDSTDGRQ